MRRLIFTFLAMYLCALIATFVMAYPQAAYLDAPQRGWMATTVTLSAFFAAGLLLIIAVAALLCVVLGYLVARMSGTASAVVSFIAGAACVALALMLTPYGQNPTEVLGLGTAWIVAGGMGAASVGSRTDSRARINWRTWFFGTLLAAGAGLGALVLQHATGTG